LKLPCHSIDLLSIQNIKKNTNPKEVAMSHLSKSKFTVFILSLVLALSSFFLLQPKEAQAIESSPESFAATAVCATYHTIKFGETLYRIGLRYNMTWTPIARVNKIGNPDRIYAGQVLCIPRSRPASTWRSNNPAVPTFEVAGVVRNRQVTIKTSDFPADTDFVVTMGLIGTRGINGIEVARTNSGKGGSFTETYSIPGKLHGQYQIAIRLESSIGYYSYN
jgi:LysM repeat protein